MLGVAYAKLGKRSEALKILGDLRELSKRRYVSPGASALILASMEGKRDEALEALERAYDDHWWNMYLINAQPWFDPYRSDPRFQALLRRMNIPEK